MATHQTTEEHHVHMFTYLGGFVLAFIFFFAFIRIWHYYEKNKVCCKRRQVSSSIQTDDPTVVYRPTAGAVHIAMEALTRRELITQQPVFVGHEEKMEAQEMEEAQRNTRLWVETIVPSNSSENVDATSSGVDQAPVEVYGEASRRDEGIENVDFLGYVDCPKIAKKCVDEYDE